MKVVFDPRCLDYFSPGHPESPRRVELIWHQLQKDKRFQFVTPQKATAADLLSAHNQELVNLVLSNSFVDPDTPNTDNIYDFAILSAGSAIKACQLVPEDNYVFSLNRPPGHHATQSSVGGFCYFNNIAVAVTKLLKANKRVAILDIDVHHGNGTQDIFLGKKGIVYCSLHQVPLYPGTGISSGQNCYNFPLPPGSGTVGYQKELIKAIKIIGEFKPDILAVSLGFDTYKNDPLANIKLDIKDYGLIGQMIKNLQLPSFFVLEGGYSEDIGLLADEFFSSYP